MMNNQLNDARYDGIQALRFLAALMVVVTHSFMYASERLGAGTVHWGAGAKGVDIFFVISGFVMVISSGSLIDARDGWKIFLTKRINRIVPLYWIATTAKLLVLLLASGLVLHAQLDWWMIIKSYVFIPSQNVDGDMRPFLSVGWTLIFEMFFYLVFAAALLLRQNIFRFVGIVLFAFSFLSLFNHNNNSAWWYLFDPIILEFYFGMLLGYAALQNRYLPQKIAVVAFFVALAYLLTASNPLSLPRVLNAGLPSTIIVWATISVEQRMKGRVPQAILLLGAASYSLYLFHPLIAPLVPTILRKLAIANFPLSVVLSTVVALVTTAVFHLWFEKPLNRYISRHVQLFRTQSVAESPKLPTGSVRNRPVIEPVVGSRNLRI